MKSLRIVSHVVAWIGIVGGILVVTGQPMMAGRAEREGYIALRHCAQLLQENSAVEAISLPRDELQSLTEYAERKERDAFSMSLIAVITGSATIVSCVLLLTVLHKTKNK